MLFLSANHMLDTAQREARCGSQPVAVEPQVFNLLVYLVRRRRMAGQIDIAKAALHKLRRTIFLCARPPPACPAWGWVALRDVPTLTENVEGAAVHERERKDGPWV